MKKKMVRSICKATIVGLARIAYALSFIGGYVSVFLITIIDEECRHDRAILSDEEFYKKYYESSFKES